MDLNNINFSWLEGHPTNWGLNKVKHVFYLSKSKVDSSEGYPILSLTMKGIKFRDISTNEGQLPENFDGYTLLEKDDIVFNPMDLNSGWVDKSNVQGLISPSYKVLRTKKDNIDRDYFKYFFQTHYTEKIFFPFGEGVHYQYRWGLGSQTLLNFPILIPPLNEQTGIVQFLDKKTKLIDNSITVKERKITLLNEQKTSLINQIVTKGLNPNVKMKDSGVEWIGEIPEHWCLISLHKLLQTNRLEFQDGNHGGEHPNPDEFIENGVPFIKPRDIQNGKVDWSDCDRLPIERCNRFRIGFSNNDDILLVNRGGSIGKVCYVNDYNNEFPYFIINPQVTYLRGKNGLSSKYVFYITKSDVFRCGVDLVLGHGSTFPFLGLSNMGDFKMVLPPQIEQEEVVKYLDNQTKEIDELVQLEQKKIDLLKKYRQSLISDVVTGKIKVTTDE